MHCTLLPDSQHVLHLQDKSGELDRSELAALYKQARGEKLSGRQLKIAMAVMDADKSGTIEFSEFEAWSVPSACSSLSLEHDSAL
mgnify:CR=1 FL=1